MEDVIAMQQAAYERVRRMQEHSRKLCAAPTAKQPSEKSHSPDDRWLLLVLLLILTQNGGSKPLLILLAYLIL